MRDLFLCLCAAACVAALAVCALAALRVEERIGRTLKQVDEIYHGAVE